MPRRGPYVHRPSRPALHLILLAALVVPVLAVAGASGDDEPIHLPWADAGLDAREAAAHLLDRLAYGARPGDVEAVVATGLDAWVERQLAADLESPTLERRLAEARSLHLSAEELAAVYPDRPRLMREAVQAGVVDREELERRRARREEERERADEVDGRRGDADRRMEGDQGGDRAMRRSLRSWAREQGYRPQREARFELAAQKVLRARYSENQLREVLTDFYFNHFNVSTTDPRAAIYVWPYERDAIRPHVLGRFGDMLHATARHPAMLHYLDNVRSVAERRRRRPPARRGPTGLNENYARELLELHTLGVDGGYDQHDVEEVARAFTGWSVLPPGGVPETVRRRVEEARRRPETGLVFDGPFVFRADRHDVGEKEILAHRLPAGRGIEDGEAVLDLLALHPATARHLSHELATRFVADEPPQALLDRLAKTFLATGGDLRATVVEIVESPEFWSEAARDAKLKSPFEMVISALRAADARISDPRALVERLGEMGQPLYAWQAPTGFPERGDAWLSAGTLLERMSFATELAENRIPGVHVPLRRAFGEDAEPESVAAFLGGPTFQKR